MDKFVIEEAITVIYVKAETFPMGVGGAFKKLHALLSEPDKRQLYGISNPENGRGIIYRAAAAEAYPGEGKENGFDTFLIREGTYIGLYLADWKKDESGVGKAFGQLLSYPGIDPKGYCLEIYVGDKDIHCLVPLIN